MKSFEIDALELSEMSLQELELIDGGNPAGWWLAKKIVEILGAVATGVAAGWFLAEATDVEEYYGGMLEPAYCYG